jgi:hypothetical protein
MAMDAIAQQALAALDVAVAGLLPVSVPVGLTRVVRIAPTQITPTGMGGYMGLQTEPQAGVYGRRVQATVRVAVQGGQDQAANDHVDLVTRTLLLQDRTDLRKKGIFKLAADAMEARATQFQLLFEYAFHPVAGEGVIQSLDLALENNLTPYKAQFVWNLATASLADEAQPLADFAVADDPDTNAAPVSQWSYNNAARRIEQNAAVRGGPLTLAQPKKAGAQLLWRPNNAPLALDKFVISCEFESASQDGIGLVFHRKDAQNFYFFLASERNRYHVFGRKQAGTYSLIGTPNTDAGFSLNTHHQLKIISFDGQLSAVLDDEQTLSVDTGENLFGGEVAYLTHGNNRARFYRARAIRLI